MGNRVSFRSNDPQQVIARLLQLAIIEGGAPRALQDAVREANTPEEVGNAIDVFLVRLEELKAIFADAADNVFDLRSQIEKDAERFGVETLAQVVSLRDEALDFGLEEDTVTAGLQNAVRRLIFVENQAEQELTEFGVALETVRARFAELKPVLEEVGLAAELADEALTEAEATLRGDFNESIQRQIRGITDPIGLALEDLAAAQEIRLRDAVAIGADIVEVERLNLLERERLLQQQQSELSNFFDEITFGGLSGASPAASLAGTRASFQAVAAQALAGDGIARDQIVALGRGLLTQSRDVFASGAGFQSDLGLVQDVVGTLLGNTSTTAANTIEALESGFEAVVRTESEMLVELRNLNARMAAMQEEQTRLNTALKRLTSQAA